MELAIRAKIMRNSSAIARVGVCLPGTRGKERIGLSAATLLRVLASIDGRHQVGAFSVLFGPQIGPASRDLGAAVSACADDGVGVAGDVGDIDGDLVIGAEVGLNLAFGSL